MKIKNQDINIKDIISAVSSLFEETPMVIKSWNEIVKNNRGSSIDNVLTNSLSLNALNIYIKSLIVDKKMDLETLLKDSDICKELKESVKPFIRQEFGDENITYVIKKEKVTELRSNTYFESGNTFDYYHIRDALSKAKDNYVINEEDDTLEFEVKSKSDDLSIVGKLTDWRTLQKRYGEILLDDLTADALDILTIFIFESGINERSWLHFSFDDTLNIRGIKGRNVESGYHKSFHTIHKTEIAKRFEFLSHVTFHFESRKLKIIGENGEIEKDKELETKQPLFAVRDQTTIKEKGKYAGIGGFTISPSDFFFKSLKIGDKTITANYTKKLLNFNHNTHKYHKRLGRYLYWRWNIEFSSKSNLSNIKIKIGSLLNIISYKEYEGYPVRVKNHVTKILDDLCGNLRNGKVEKGSQVIKDWDYQEEIDENKVGQNVSNWFEEYWMKQIIIISPPTELKEILINKKGSKLTEQLEEVPFASDRIAFEFKEEDKLTLSPEVVINIREKKGLSQQQAAKEIGIPRTTLLKYENRVSKNPYTKTKEKLEKWIGENVKYLN